MRSIHKAAISFGLVNVPVKLYGATEEHDIKSHQVHGSDGGRIRYKRVCEDCGEAVAYDDIVKGYEVGDELAILTDDDIASITGESSRDIEVVEFVPTGSIDPLAYEKSYYLGPDKSLTAYQLLAAALMGTERVAIVKFNMRGKTRLAALRVTGKQHVLTLHTLHWSDEIRDPEFKELDKAAKIDPAQLAMARSLIESMANEFNPDRYRDTYQEELRVLVAAKAGEPPQGTEDVSDLLTKLAASTRETAGRGMSAYVAVCTDEDTGQALALTVERPFADDVYLTLSTRPLDDYDDDQKVLCQLYIPKDRARALAEFILRDTDNEEMRTISCTQQY